MAKRKNIILQLLPWLGALIVIILILATTTVHAQISINSFIATDLNTRERQNLLTQTTVAINPQHTYQFTMTIVNNNYHTIESPLNIHYWLEFYGIPIWRGSYYSYLHLSPSQTLIIEKSFKLDWLAFLANFGSFTFRSNAYFDSSQISYSKLVVIKS